MPHRDGEMCSVSPPPPPSPCRYRGCITDKIFVNHRAGVVATRSQYKANGTLRRWGRGRKRGRRFASTAFYLVAKHCTFNVRSPVCSRGLSAKSGAQSGLPLKVVSREQMLRTPALGGEERPRRIHSGIASHSFFLLSVRL